jgi:thioredoxin reductase (NADPH)
MAEDAAFLTLTETEIEAITASGIKRHVEPGDYLYRAGDVAYDFFVVIAGLVEIVSGSGEAESIIAHHGPGRFLGELNLLTGMRVFVSARVIEAGEVVGVSRDDLRKLIAAEPILGDKILAAFIARRSILLAGAAASVRVIGSRFSTESRRIREFLSRSRIPHEWLDPDFDSDIEAILTEFRVAPSELPVVITATRVLRNATPGAVADHLGLTLVNLPERHFDLVVVGAGPAGLAAAVYGASEGLTTLVVEMFSLGGQAGTSSRIENYLGFPTGISGAELAQRAEVQAEKFGARMTSPCEVGSLREVGNHLAVHLSDGTDIVGRAVIAATGAHYRRLDVPRLDEFEGRGVYYAATEIEARLCDASPVVVVGGGNSAGQAALFLAGSGSHVTVVIRGSDLRESMSMYLADRLQAQMGIDIRTKSHVTGLEGADMLRGVRVANPSGESVIASSGLFSFIGAEPASRWLSGFAALDGHGFVLTDRAIRDAELGPRWTALGRQPLPFETSYPGLFAAGDLRSGSTKRVAAAVGEGSACIASVHQFFT